METPGLPETMSWMSQEEIQETEHVRKILLDVAAAGGILRPTENAQALGFLTAYHARATERYGKAKAMRDQRFASLLQADEKLSVSRAEAIAKGEEFGQRTTFYEQQAAGYLEIINTFKKVQEYWVAVARNEI